MNKAPRATWHENMHNAIYWKIPTLIISRDCCVQLKLLAFWNFSFLSSVENMTHANWDRILNLCINIFETDSWPLDIKLGWKQFSLGKLFICDKQLTLIWDISIVNDFVLCSRFDFRCLPDSLQRKLGNGCDWLISSYLFYLWRFLLSNFRKKRDSTVCWTSSFKVYTVKKNWSRKIDVFEVAWPSCTWDRPACGCSVSKSRADI